MKLNSKKKLEIGAYIVTMALAVPSYGLARIAKDELVQDLLINLAATFAGVGFLFFLLNRFFGIDNDPVDKIKDLLKNITESKGNLVSLNERRKRFPVGKNLFDAKNVNVLGNTLINFLDVHRELIIEKVQSGVSIRLLLINPSSKASDIFREVWEYSTFDSDIQRSFTLIESIQKALSKVGKLKGNFEVRLVPWIPSCTMIIVDPESNNGKATIGINNLNYSTSVNNRPYLVLEKHIHTHWLNYYNQEFDKLWNVAKSYHEELG